MVSRNEGKYVDGNSTIYVCISNHWYRHVPSDKTPRGRLEHLKDAVYVGSGRNRDILIGPNENGMPIVHAEGLTKISQDWRELSFR
ncbi:MAG: YkuS family protein [archaeon]|nr:YkuS family protein [archaeon]MCR4323485.1 YkuS family protein [Nanoarchaeota archaeon]